MHTEKGGNCSMDIFKFVLILIIILLIIYLFLQRLVIHKTIKQMDDIERNSGSNRQLLSITTDKQFEKLLDRINIIYKERQKERITYQRRELQIRREIENISHDLRTPLTSIMGYVDLIKEPNTSEAEAEEYLQIIQKRAKVLQGFIQDFYVLSRMESEDFPLDFTTISVQNTLSDTIVAYYHDFEKKHIRVSIELEEKQITIIADKIQFNRIMNNLIVNSLKYAKETFVIKQFSTKDECILQFQNDKNQITEDELPYIFDRFYTNDLSRNTQSTGLGLTISKLLTEMMMGKVEARIEGDLFIIELRWKIRR